MPHNCYDWLARIKAVEREYTSLRLATDRLLDEARRDPTILRRELRRRDIEVASDRLEGTYIIRLFAEFETGLRLFWSTIRDTEPRTQDLLDGVAARQGIPHDRIAGAHSVREYRNSLVHEREETVEAISIGGARRHLCLFLNCLPPTW
jgi:hypothetical protein